VGSRTKLEETVKREKRHCEWELCLAIREGRALDHEGNERAAYSSPICNSSLQRTRAGGSVALKKRKGLALQTGETRPRRGWHGGKRVRRSTKGRELLKKEAL